MENCFLDAARFTPLAFDPVNQFAAEMDYFAGYRPRRAVNALSNARNSVDGLLPPALRI